MADPGSGRAHVDAISVASVVLLEDARLSGDGKQLTYTRHAPRADGSSRPEIVLVDELTSQAHGRVLAPGSRSGRWSPDGRNVTFVRSVRGGVRLGTREPRPGAPISDVGEVVADIGDVAWSPDGRRLAAIASALRAGRRPHADSRSSPDVAIIDLADGSTRWLGVVGHAAGIAWSPDGSTLATRVRHPDGYVAWLELIDVGTGATTATIGGPTSRILGMSWAVDGTSLVVLGAPDFSFHPGLHQFDLASGRLEAIIDEPAPYVEDLGGWLDPGRLLLSGRERARSALYVLDVVGRELERRVDLDGRASRLATDGTGGRFATVRETAAEPPVVIVGDVASGSWFRVPDARQALVDLGPAARPESISIPAGDVTLDGWVLPARGRMAPRRQGRPAVVLVHGGPHHDVGDEWDVGVGQVLADHGFVVAWTNPRGSTSYGRVFTDAVRGDVGGAELDDILAIADALARRPDVDPDRIGICGYSHGGFLTASAITRTRRFAAAVCWAPFTDLLSEWGMSDEGRGWGRWVIGMHPTDEPERYRDASPAWQVHGRLAPTLLIHGEQDERCPIGQSVLFHELLAATGTPTRLVRIAGAGHGLFETPADTAEVAQETLDWFTTHLRPEEDAA